MKMTTLFLTYELKVAVLIAVFYIFWRLLVANETWHRLNRIVLLSTAIMSFILPLCVITIHQTVVIDSPPESDDCVLMEQSSVSEGRGGLRSALPLCLSKNERQEDTYSDFGNIQLYHSADVLLVELLTALQWFNPTMWMLRADLRTIHEYEADQQVLSHGFNDIQYLHLLIRKAATQSGYSLANGFINSTLKKRVNMMTKPKSSRKQWLKIAYILPIVAISLYASCETKTDYQTKEESALILIEKDSVECWGIRVPAGAFYSWLVNGQLAERGVVEEDGRWNVLTCLPTESYVTFLDGKEIFKNVQARTAEKEA